MATLGPVPSGLPSIGLPDVTWSDIPPLIGASVSIFVLILAQSAATSRAYAAKYNEQFSENVDLVGPGAASIAAGASGTFVAQFAARSVASGDTTRYPFKSSSTTLGRSN